MVADHPGPGAHGKLATTWRAWVGRPGTPDAMRLSAPPVPPAPGRGAGYRGEWSCGVAAMEQMALAVTRQRPSSRARAECRLRSGGQVPI